MAQRLQQGEKALLSEGRTHDPFKQGNRGRRFYEGELQRQFLCEEEFLFPTMRRTPPNAEALLDSLARDHRNISSMIGNLEGRDRENLHRRLAEIGTRLEEHIRTEERTLFPMCEARMSKADLEKLGHEFRSLRECV